MSKRRAADVSEELKPSDKDCIALAAAVLERYTDLFYSHQRIMGTALLIPASMRGDVKRWQFMVQRHQRGDFRNTDAEYKSTKMFAQWTLDMNAELRNQPKQAITWRD
jgi:hypothetical protein